MPLLLADGGSCDGGLGDEEALAVVDRSPRDDLKEFLKEPAAWFRNTDLTLAKKVPALFCCFS